MKRTRLAASALLLFLTGCGEPSPAEIQAEQKRLEQRWRPNREKYLRSLSEADQATQESLAWLNGEALTAPRTQAVSGARIIMERWARIHFVPRVIHEELRFDDYRSRAVRSRQKQLLDRLRREYVEWHDYQRYAQYAWQTALHETPPGRLPPRLEEFRLRLQARPSAAADLAGIPR
jgi:hypothetical protein